MLANLVRAFFLVTISFCFSELGHATDSTGVSVLNVSPSGRACGYILSSGKDTCGHTGACDISASTSLCAAGCNNPKAVASLFHSGGTVSSACTAKGIIMDYDEAPIVQNGKYLIHIYYAKTVRAGGIACPDIPAHFSYEIVCF